MFPLYTHTYKHFWMNFSTIRASDGYFCRVSTGKALHQYTFKIKVLRNNPAIVYKPLLADLALDYFTYGIYFFGLISYKLDTFRTFHILVKITDKILVKDSKK